ncbi:MAG TPA: SAM-dependent methyltransferase [Thioalkalivibrio sp.]|nr:SAM-dependent methyltransferase [Thioalkalivibrio sp.]
MSTRTLGLSDELYDYLMRVSVREGDLLACLREETQALPHGRMQISPEQGQFMRLLVGLMGARRGIEIGTFTGYSALCIAQGMGDMGELVCCDTSEEWTQVARRYWREAGVDHRLRLELGPGIDTLNRLLAEGEAGRFDFAFIDADKQNYPAYYERCYELLHPGGIIAIDNTLWGGAVADESNQEPSTRAIRRFNEAVHRDERVEMSLLPIGDGLTLARRKI